MSLTSSLFIGTIIWALAVFFHFLKFHTLKIRHFAYSQLNYHIMMSGFVLSICITSILTYSFKPILLFLFFAIVGILGESLFSAWWFTFFGKKFWIYTEDILFGGYSSFLNFIPWGVGGLLTLLIAHLVFPDSMIHTIFSDFNTWFYLIITFFATFSLQLIIFYCFFINQTPHFKFHTVSLSNYLFFVFPILSVILLFIFRFGVRFIFFTFALAIILPLTEYLFGKATQFFISHKLWSYSYGTIDNGHFTPLAVIPFIIGGYWFVIFYGFLLLFIK